MYPESLSVGIVVDTVAEADVARRNHPIRIVVDISVRRAGRRNCPHRFRSSRRRPHLTSRNTHLCRSGCSESGAVAVGIRTYVAIRISIKYSAKIINHPSMRISIEIRIIYRRALNKNLYTIFQV